MEETIIKNLNVELDEDVKIKARVNALKQKMKIKDYITKLILEDEDE